MSRGAGVWPGRASGSACSFSSLSREYSRRNLASDVVGYNRVLNDVCVKRKPYLLRDVYDDMLLDGVQPEFMTFHLLITGASLGNRLQDAVHFFDEMKGMGFNPNHLLYNSLISACGRSQQLRRAIQLVSEMETYGMQPKYATFVALLNACGAAGSTDEAESVVKRMTAAGLTLDEYCYGALIMAEKNKKPVTASTFDKIFGLLEKSKAQAKTLPSRPLDTMDDELAAAVAGNGPADRQSARQAAHNAAVVACADLGNEEAMTRAVQILEADGHQLDSFALGRIVKCFITLGELEKAMAVFERLMQAGRAPVLDIYISMIDGLLSTGTPSNVAGAIKLLEDMDGKGYFLNPRVGGELLHRACSGSVDLTAAYVIWDMMLKRNMRPTARALRMFIAALQANQVPATDPRLLKASEYLESSRLQWRAEPREQHYEEVGSTANWARSPGL